jgi:quercetin dioxygenase-like cupin family protein
MARSTEGGRNDGGFDKPQGLLLGSKGNGGAFALMEYEIPPRMLVAPRHSHRREDEYSYVLGGRIGVQVGEETSELDAHGVIGKPRGVPHTLWNPGDVPARVLELIVPGGFERCLAELYRARAPSPARLQELWAEYEIAMEDGSADELIGRHELRGLMTGL